MIMQLTENGGITDSKSKNGSHAETDDNEKKQFLVPAEINIVSQTLSLNCLADRIQKDKIDFGPDFREIWTEKQQSRLIESLMLRIPIPAFYFYASDDGEWKIIDGFQRLTAVKNIVIGKNNKTVYLPLTGLEYYADFEWKTFPELPRQYQRRILEAQITVYVVQKSTPSEIVYNIFLRLQKSTPSEIVYNICQLPTT